MSHPATIPALVKQPTRLQLFMFSAVTWNAHRIHYDAAYAGEEGYPDVLVQSHLHGCFLCEAVVRAIGGQARLVRFAWQNRRYAVAGDTLTCSGNAVNVEDSEAGRLVDYELEERNQRDEVCATGSATVLFPAEPST